MTVAGRVLRCTSNEMLKRESLTWQGVFVLYLWPIEQTALLRLVSRRTVFSLILIEGKKRMVSDPLKLCVEYAEVPTKAYNSDLFNYPLSIYYQE